MRTCFEDPQFQTKAFNNKRPAAQASKHTTRAASDAFLLPATSLQLESGPPVTSSTKVIECFKRLPCFDRSMWTPLASVRLDGVPPVLSTSMPLAVLGCEKRQDHSQPWRLLMRLLGTWNHAGPVRAGPKAYREDREDVVARQVPSPRETVNWNISSHCNCFVAKCPFQTGHHVRSSNPDHPEMKSTPRTQ